MSLGGEFLGVRKLLPIQATVHLALWAISRHNLVLGNVPSFQGWGGMICPFSRRPSSPSPVFHSSALGGGRSGRCLWLHRLCIHSQRASVAGIQFGSRCPAGRGSKDNSCAWPEGDFLKSHTSSLLVVTLPGGTSKLLSPSDALLDASELGIGVIGRENGMKPKSWKSLLS